jgi:hypothetical protein
MRATTGILTGAGGVLQYKGEIKLNEFASANDDDEYEWSITIEGKGKHHDRMKQLVSQARATAQMHGHSQTRFGGRRPWTLTHTHVHRSRANPPRGLRSL